MKSAITLALFLLTLCTHAQTVPDTPRGLLTRAGATGATGSVMIFVGNGLALSGIALFTADEDKQTLKVTTFAGLGLTMIGMLMQVGAWQKVTRAGKLLPKNNNVSLNLDNRGIGVTYSF